MTNWQIGLAIFLLVIVGIIVGYELGKTITMYRKPGKKEMFVGTMVVNTMDPKKDVVRFELDVPISEAFGYDVVRFTVKHEDESQYIIRSLLKTF